jgi:precorrin-8X/cobalt-precorrin-8 methylmutase
MPVFDRYIVVDWSAAATPRTGADSIWVADLVAGARPTLTNPRTRRDAAAWLDAAFDRSGEQRILVGVDACLGYPRGTAAYFGLDGVPWKAMWDAIASLSNDDDGNRNNRFEVAAHLNERGRVRPGPFWGCVDDRSAPVLSRKKPAGFPVPEYRLVEARLRSASSAPKSVWQLLGAGSVGGQTLTLLPILRRLLDRSEVWPFTTGLWAPEPTSRIVVAEVWPSWFVREIPPGMVRDAAQVAGTAAALAAADAAGDLASWFSPSVDESEPVVREEGWILGVG